MDDLKKWWIRDG